MITNIFLFELRYRKQPDVPHKNKMYLKPLEGYHSSDGLLFITALKS